MSIKENLERINTNIQAALSRSGAQRDIKLVAVTKNQGVERIKEAIACGVSRIGENRVQESLEKHELIDHEGLEWHMIGHLQRNKVAQAVDIFDWIDSIDSIKLARKISEKCAESGKTVKGLVEVNISGEEQKYGIAPEDAQKLISDMREFKNIELKGLMTMAPHYENPEDARPVFRRLYELKSTLGLEYTSMGMTNDYEKGIEEGADFVRIGSALFG